MEKLHAWCYKVLPLAYDDSLSYYEVLCKVTAKINEMIASGGFTSDELKELQDDIAALQSSDTSQNAEIESIKTSLANLSTSVTSHTSEIDALQASEASQNTAIADIDGNIANIEADISQMQSDIADLQAGGASVDNDPLAHVPIRENVVYSAQLTNHPFTFESYPYFKITLEDGPHVQNSILRVASGQNAENVLLNWDTGADLDDYNLTLLPIPKGSPTTEIIVNNALGIDVNTMNNLVLGAPPANMAVSSTAIYADTWMFGDSYYGFDRARVFGALYAMGIYPECSVAFAGANSVHALTWLNKMLKTHVPKVLIWSLGLNDASVTASLSNLSAAKTICDNHHIRLIPATLPPIKNRDFTAYNTVVRGYPQYVDQETAVVSEGPWDMHSVFSTVNKAINDSGTLATKNGYSATNAMAVEDGLVINYTLTGSTGVTLVALYNAAGSLLPASVKATSTTETAYTGTLTVSGATSVRFSYKDGVAGTTATVSRGGGAANLRTFDAMASDAIYGVTIGKRIDAAGIIQTSQDNFSITDFITVSPGDVISYDFYSLNLNPGIAAYNTDLSYLRESSVMAPEGNGHGAPVPMSGTYTVPSGVASIRICWVNQYAGYCTIPISSPINLTTLKKTVKTIIGRDGSITEGSWDYMYTTEPIPVKVGDTVEYNFDCFGGFPGLAAYDEQGTYLASDSVINPGESGTRTNMTGGYTVPSGVDTIRFAFAYALPQPIPDVTITPTTDSTPSNTGKWAPGLLSSDGVHPTEAGAAALAVEYAKVCNGVVS